MTALRLAPAGPDISVVVPVHNEAENVAGLTAEIIDALSGRAIFEIVFVDDASTDTTARELQALAARHPQVRPIAHDRRSGQSIAVTSGVLAARGATVVTIDGDGQNDPKFIFDLVRVLASNDSHIGLVAGRRVGRKASGFKRLQSRVANTVRGAVLHDSATDTGCGLKAFRRDLFLRLPVFDGLHRFLPALIRREGYGIVQVDVVDRDRKHGVSKYGMGNRLWVGLMDLFGVWWLIRRRRSIPIVRELQSDACRSVADDRNISAGRVCH
jgi:glycosyltransferase involved in cell wall biosynthesis